MIMKTSAALMALGITGCAAAPMPQERNPGTESSIRAAEEAGANQVPAARLQLQMAKDEEQEAQKMASTGDERARLMLARSQSDAELALAIAKEASVHNEATRAADDLKTVKARTTPPAATPATSTPAAAATPATSTPAPAGRTP